MNSRPSVRHDTRKMLWSESMGHCMNPECHNYLFPNGSCVGELAHITPRAEGGDVSFDNLIVLCRTCHKQIDDQRTEQTTGRLREWKGERNIEIREQFNTTFASFDKLRAVVAPLLQRNGQIFKSYGPGNQNADNDDHYNLWLTFESELIANNQKLEILLKQNEQLLHYENREIVQNFITQFVTHAREFVHTRDNRCNPRKNLFPENLCCESIFRIGQPIELI